MESVRDIVEGSCVVSDVLARRTIAAGQRKLQLALDIQQIYRRPVDLQLRQVFLRGRAIQPAGELLSVENIVQAEHRLAVVYVSKRAAGGWRRSDLFGRGGTGDDFRMRLLQGFEFLQQGVEVRVRDFRIAVVVELPVVAHLVSEFLPAGMSTHPR